MLADPLDLRDEVRLEIGERLERQVDDRAGRLRELRAHIGVVERQHTAAGVLDDDDLPGPEEVLADDQRADGVVGGEAAGVADDVRLAGSEAEDLLDGEARVHAGDDGEPARRLSRPPRPVERRGVGGVLREGAFGLGRRHKGLGGVWTGGVGHRPESGRPALPGATGWGAWLS